MTRGRGGGKLAERSGRPGPITVDPRMRSRRIGVRRDAGRRRLRRFAAGAAISAALVGAGALTRTSLLDVDRVAVEGAGRSGAGEVRRAAGVATGEPLIAVDTGAVADRVERLPWVARARVDREWPATVRIRVTEREPAALVGLPGGRVAVVDAGGWVMTVAPEGTAGPEAGLRAEGEGGAPVVTGVRGRVVAGERLREDGRDAVTVAVALGERVPGAVASVSTALDADLVAGGTVRLGSTEQLDAKVTALQTVLGDVDLACLEVLDVRVPGSPALTRDQRCS
ncbi:MAG TPA: FtsQ-type POTRA domain-containing protein [Acidimicrobiales bacterium]